MLFAPATEATTTNRTTAAAASTFVEGDFIITRLPPVSEWRTVRHSDLLQRSSSGGAQVERFTAINGLLWSATQPSPKLLPRSLAIVPVRSSHNPPSLASKRSSDQGQIETLARIGTLPVSAHAPALGKALADDGQVQYAAGVVAKRAGVSWALRHPLGGKPPPPYTPA
jgi:hypothetical protein